jgi:hypothetical protein
VVGWIALGIGYVVLILGFRILGGVASAMDALQSWGRASGGRQRSASSS